MKAIINGLRYDTEKATLLGEASTHAGGDFSHWDAGLYRTPRSGRYFIAGTGGPMTMFARPDGNGHRGGSKIVPMDREDALAWAEEHLTTDEVEAAFADSVEDA